MIETVEITTNDTFDKFKQHKFGYLGGRDFAISDDGLNWSVINHYTDLSLTNPSTALIGEYYYIASNEGFWKTQDFNTFFKLKATISDDKHSGLTGFEWFQDLNGSWFIKYNATSTNDAVYTYYADFDETTDSFVNTFQQFNLPFGGASGLALVRGKYYIWQKGDKLYTADNYTDQFSEVATDIKGNTAHQQFSIVVSDNYLYVYFLDSDKTYMRSSKITNLIHWSDPVEIKDVGLGSYFYNAEAVSVYPDYQTTRTFDKVLKVTANGFKQAVPISCLVFSSLQVQWEQNSTWQVNFTVFDDKSVSYTMLSEEADIEFNGQHYIVKQAVEDASGGVDTKQITATHIYNEISRVRQRKTKTGTLTYSVKDILSFYLDDKTANPFGFTYAVHGTFDKQQIQDLGNSSGSDMLSKITEQWPQAVIYPDNKAIHVYTPAAFAKNFGGRIDYLNNSSEVKMTVDSTTITNQVKAFGKQVENTNDNASDNAPAKYYFEPFIVEDQASIKQYGLHPMDDISDERFTNKSKMATYVKGQLSPNPAVSIETTGIQNEMPVAGEQRHLIAKPLSLETDLTIIGYTWSPFDASQATQLSFANLPASILKTQANINNRIRTVQLIAQQAINSARTATTNYVSPTDPMQNDNIDVRAGDIWTLPLLKKTNGLMKMAMTQSESSSDTNQTIYTDSNNMDKAEVQLSIWNGSKWLEIGNQRTINTINDNQHKVADQVAEQQKGIAKAVQDAQTAVTNADKAIEQAGFANDTAKIAKEVANSVKEDATTAKNDSATALQQAKDAMTKAQQALDGIGEGVDLSDIQKQIDDVNTSLGTVSSDLDTAKKSLDDVAKTAKANGESIVSINKDVAGIKTDVADTQGNVTQVVQQAKELSTAITNAKGDISTLQQTATALSSSIKDNTDNISSVKQTATKLSSDMKDAQGNISSLQQSATDLSSTIGTIQKDLSDTQKTVSTQGTQITQNTQDITSKANSADLDATNKRMTTAETAITQNAKDIESKASQSDVNTLTGRVSTAESNITQNANSIKSKVSSSDVQNLLDTKGYATQKWTGSEIDQKADEISHTVADVSNKVDNLNIGTRNYIENSLPTNSDGWNFSSGGTVDYKVVDGQYLEITRTGGSWHQINRQYQQNSDSWFWDLKAGETYIISLDVLMTTVPVVSSPTTVHLRENTGSSSSQINTNSAGIDLQSVIAGPNTWYRISVPQVIPSNWITDTSDVTSARLIIESRGGADTDVIRIRNIKLEKGNKATDWTPAPEDLATVTALSKVDQKADSISSTVTNNKKDADSKFTNINQTISGIQSTVKNKADSSTVTQLDKLVQSKVDSKDYSSKVTQLANDINLRVQTKDLISQINQQAGGNTLIQVSNGQGKLYLDASSVVFSGEAFIPSAAIANLDVDKITGSKASFIQAGFNSINSSISIDSGAIHFKQANGGMDFTSKGMNFYDIINGEHIGSQGPNNWSGDARFNGITTRLDPLGDYMGWSAKARGEDAYYSKLFWYGPNLANTLGIKQGWHFDDFVNFTSDIYLNTKALNFGDAKAHYAPFMWGNGDAINIRRRDNKAQLMTIRNVGGVYIGNQLLDGGGSAYAGNNNGWWFRNQNKSLAKINVASVSQSSRQELKKNIALADTNKLANSIYNMDVTTWQYKTDNDSDKKHIGAVIGKDYNISNCFLTDERDAINTTNVLFSLVATVQEQAQHISNLEARLKYQELKGVQ